MMMMMMMLVVVVVMAMVMVMVMMLNMYVGNRSLEGTLPRNFWENLSGCTKFLTSACFSKTLVLQLGALYSLTICNESFHETCI